jgi:TRAP-type uncharacterized transport system substrate-binding protein
MELGALKTDKPRTLGMIGLCILAAALLAWGAHSGWAAWYGESTTTVTISAGPLDSRRSKMVEFLADRGQEEKVSLKLVGTDSLEDAFRKVELGQLDAAFVYNAVDMKQDAHVLTVAGLPLEPLHIVVRKSLVASDPFIKSLLAGRRVNLGPVGSTERLLAQDLLAFLKLKPADASGKGDYLPTSIPKEDLFKFARAAQSAPAADRPRMLAELPDAILLTAPMPSAVIQALLDTDHYVLVPFPFAQAFCMDTSTEKTDDIHINRLYLEPTEIGAGTYMSADATPSRSCTTLGMRMVLVANKNASRPAIAKLTSVVMNGVTARILKAVDPRTVPSPHEPHPGAIDFLDRDKPLVVQKVMDRLTQSLSIFGAFSAGFLTLYGLWRARRMKAPQNYFTEIRKIALMARGEGADDPNLPSDSAERLRVLDERLMLLKLELISDFCQGRFKSELMLLNLFTSIADARRELMSPMGQFGPRQEGRKQAAYSEMDLMNQAG